MNQVIVCPVITCHAENDIRAEVCHSCGISLDEYKTLLFFPDLLFNVGYEALQDGRYMKAREFFFAVICWCPYDLWAKNGLAMASYHLGLHEEAAMYWQDVLLQNAGDPVARKGLEENRGIKNR